MRNEDYFKYMSQMVNGVHCDATGNHYRDTKVALKNILEQVERESKYIGITDIKNKRIYADTSIVEINFNPCGDKEVNIYGYFSYVEERLRCEFFQYFKERDSFIPAYIDIKKDSRMKDIKIVDTFKENKLGLIKS